jgi:acyl-lipid omega-6 desaturase (Delta-12 desaturase)
MGCVRRTDPSLAASQAVVTLLSNRSARAEKYRARSSRGRLGYRLLRNPLVMFGLGPVLAMVIVPRLVARGTRPRLRNSVLETDAALVVLAGALCRLIGWEDLLIVWVPAALLAGSVGIWPFYVQHRFENAYWQRQCEWSFADAALHGSSYLMLPKLLQFFTGNIGLHHVHHLNARIPNYNLQRAHDDNAMFASVRAVSLRDGVRAVKFKLWDEETGRLVTFAPRNLDQFVVWSTAHS